MARLKRKLLKFDEESLNNLAQEIYNDNHNIRGEIKSLFNRWSKTVNSPQEIAILGKDIVGLIAQEIKNNAEKSNLLKMMKEIVLHESKEKESTNTGSISSDEQSEILKRVKAEHEKNKSTNK